MIYKPQSENFKEVQLLCKNFVKVLKISGVFCKKYGDLSQDRAKLYLIKEDIF